MSYATFCHAMYNIVPCHVLHRVTSPTTMFCHVNELNFVNQKVMLMPDDFKSYSKIRVDNHMFNKDIMPSKFKVKEYCPIVFRNLRERFGLEDADYMYIVECHAQTLLPQYLAMYRITVNDAETYLVVMRNVFSPRLSIHKKYDLKGSTVDRSASDKERLKELPTFKDNDFLNDGAKIFIGPEQRKKLLDTLQSDVDFLSSLNLMDYSLIVGIHDRDQEDESGINFAMPSGADEEELEEEDGESGSFVASSGDQLEYGDDADGGSPPDSPQPITPMPQFTGELDPDLEHYGVHSNPESGRREIYFMALIDILTKYGMKKRTAQAAKTVKHGAGAEISTVHPEQYAKRFMEFISKCVE
ncbi:unnamed protein product [Candidula unifasciata]|uniref:PIPK domain-containing protein n=1 Tax=Candidula unifasciata TaxID=100452 RepID=A0A8S3ZLJ8_9EUPU|nr:unnamed protein product [Candidula unifasciata]